jgi:hypothetical protein
MGQQAAVSGTWLGQNKPTSQDSHESYGTAGARQKNPANPPMERDDVKNSKTRFETETRNPSEIERKSSDFASYGMAVS